MATSIIKGTDNYYREIPISSSDSKIESCYAYTENGTVYVRITFVAGLAAGWHNDIPTTIANKYKPRSVVRGSASIASSVDAGKYHSITFGSNGNFQFYLSATNNTHGTAAFIYPLKAS